ncbi:hypothetical protein HYALB_00008359 [Hymenoscyphus albidus]|uniref:Uncharacterized protein n=1 Tax=Hymenoscyphus albidus TaxID=595503 RepID=A0A9N9LPQ0_9HELO|nr:hypothetical protein HYALB_00008359 [Hymenoscyphus albidus]
MKLLIYVALTFASVAIAIPVSNAISDADDLVRNSWSAKRESSADADDLVRNSWSAKRSADAAAGSSNLAYKSLP